MKLGGYVMAFGALAAVMACAPAGEPAAAKTDPAADVAAIAKFRDGYVAAFKASDAAAIGAMFAPDAHSMENNQVSAIGPEGITTTMTGMYAAMTPTDLILTSEKTEVSGDLAYDRGTFKSVVTPKAGGAAMTDSGRYLVVLKRQADGSWKLAEEMGNSATPLPMPPKKD